MCEHFSCVYTQDDRILFTEQDSHSTILERARIHQGNYVTARTFVKLECQPPYAGLDVDEWTSLPAWFEEIWNDPVRRNELHQRIVAIATRIDAIWERSDKLSNRLEERRRLACQPYWAVYHTVSAQINDQRIADMDAVKAEIDRVGNNTPLASRGTALEPYYKLRGDITSRAWALREAVHRTVIDATFNVARPYNALAIQVNTRAVNQINRLSGYLPAPTLLAPDAN